MGEGNKNPPIPKEKPAETVNTNASEQALLYEENEDSHGDEHSEHKSPEAKSQYTMTRIAAEGGNAHAQAVLGEFYHDGYGVTQNYREAFYWFNKAAPKGDVLAMIYLGRYYRGEYPRARIVKDDMRAEYWLQKAARSGDSDAILQLGVYLVLKVEEGDSSRKEEAAWWYNQATGGPVDKNYTPPPLNSEIEEMMDKEYKQ